MIWSIYDCQPEGYFYCTTADIQLAPIIQTENSISSVYEHLFIFYSLGAVLFGGDYGVLMVKCCAWWAHNNIGTSPALMTNDM